LEPQSFIAARPLLSDRRELLVRVNNGSPVSMDSVQLRISIAGKETYIRLPRALRSEESLTLGTGIGPVAGSAAEYLVQVTDARAVR
ncbi:MAG: hypothetical protein ACPHLL_07520, partial [Porticoccaceae bacterium]